LIKYLEEKAEPNLRATLKLGALYDVEKFNAYISSKPVKQQQLIIRSGSRIQEYNWDDDDSKKWLGNEVGISIYLDVENRMLLSIAINVDSPNDVSTQQISEIMVNELVSAGIISKESLKILD